MVKKGGTIPLGAVQRYYHGNIGATVVASKADIDAVPLVCWSLFFPPVAWLLNGSLPLPALSVLPTLL